MAVIDMGGVDGSPTLQVSIYSEVSGNPGSSLYVMTTPASISSGEKTFTAPDNATLTGGTDYFIVLENTTSSGRVSVRTTSSDDEEGWTGWEVFDSIHAKRNDDAWVTEEVALRFSLVRTLATNARLTWLTLTAAGKGVDLKPSFSSGRFTYTADVVNSEVSVNPLKTDPNATVTYLWGASGNREMLDHDGQAPGHQVDLAVGENVFRVRVTAEDGTTEHFYTVTVTRRARPARTASIADATGYESDGKMVFPITSVRLKIE